jgi:pellino
MDTATETRPMDENILSQSTISRYACRIVVSRHPPYTARVYAAGFDGSKNIFLGVRDKRRAIRRHDEFFQEKSIKWKNHLQEMDGVTTNGILLMHIDGDQFDSNAQPTKWREVSVGGSVFDLGEGRLKFNYETAVSVYMHREQMESSERSI